MKRIFCQSRAYEIEILACVPGAAACRGCRHSRAKFSSEEIAAEAIKFFGPDVGSFFSLLRSLKQKQRECLESVKDVPEHPAAADIKKIIAAKKKFEERDKAQKEFLKLIFFRTYLNAVYEVRCKRMSLDEKLLKVARPFYEYISLEGLLVEDADFIDETVDLEYDLDRSRLHYDTKRYWIEDTRPMLTAVSRITILDFECFEKRSYTLHDLYMYGRNKHAKKIETEKRYLTEFYRRNVKSKQWLTGLTRAKISNKDLLTQILVVYSLKRAINGDEDASLKFFDLYKVAASLYAERWASNSKLPVYYVKKEALLELYRWLSGFSRKPILNAIFQGKDLKSIPSGIKKLFLYQLTEEVPALLKIAIATGSHSLVTYCLNPGSLVSPGTEWWGRYNKSHTRIESLRKKPLRFSRTTFIPQKGNNLTIWLFGTKKSRMQGKFFQLLSEISRSYVKEWQKHVTFKKDSSAVDRALCKFEDLPDVATLDKIIGRHDVAGMPDFLEMPPRHSIKNERNEIIKNLKNRFGVSNRNANIFVDCLEKKKRKVLAKKYSLSERQIYTIFTNFKKILQAK